MTYHPEDDMDEPEYEFVEAEARNDSLFAPKYVPDTSKARMTRVGITGWASSLDRPYRPLGTPDLNRAKRPVPGKRVKKDEGQPIEIRDLDTGPSHDIPTRPPAYRLSKLAIKDLKKEVSASALRARACRTGGSFVQMHSSGARTHRESTRRKSGKLPPIRKDPFAGEKEEEEEEEEELDLDPSVSVRERCIEFNQACESLDSNLHNALSALRDERLDMYRRKYTALRVGDALFNAEEWRLEAEKRRIEVRLTALDRHKWYGRLLKLVSTSPATPPVGALSHRSYGQTAGHVGGDGDGARQNKSSRAEQNIVAAVRDVVESDREFDVTEFKNLVRRKLSPADIAQGERLLSFIRKELDYKDEDYWAYCNAYGIPVPSSLDFRVRELGYEKNSHERNSMKLLGHMSSGNQSGQTAGLPQHVSNMVPHPPAGEPPKKRASFKE